jgi:Phosphotransferase enzyme family
VTEVPLAGGDVNVGANVVVRVGDTVRRPTGAHTPAVQALLRHFEQVGFDSAPRVLVADEDGREVLSFVAGDAALSPIPSEDRVVAELGALLRRMHDAQAGFYHAAHAPWQRMVGAPEHGEVVCHNDLFWPNVVVCEGHVQGLIDWDLAAPAPRLFDLASAANFWVALRPDDQCDAWGVPTDRRPERLRALLDGYELSRGERPALLDAVAEKTRVAIATYRTWGRDERRPGWREMWDRDGDRYLQARAGWLEAHRRQLAQWLR